MSSIEIQSLQALKEVSGVGVSECKKALTDCGGDMSRALLELLKDQPSKMLQLAQNQRTPVWVLETLAQSKIEEIVFAVSKNSATPKTTKATANQETTVYSSAQNVAAHDRQIAELRREISQIKKAYNSLLHSLESRDKELFELLEVLNKNVNQRSTRPANYITFSLGEF